MEGCWEGAVWFLIYKIPNVTLIMILESLFFQKKEIHFFFEICVHPKNLRYPVTLWGGKGSSLEGVGFKIVVVILQCPKRSP